MSVFRRKTLDGILSSFEKVANDLDNHINRKAYEAFDLQDLKADVETKLKAVEEEIDRADRVLAKVAEFVA